MKIFKNKRGFALLITIASITNVLAQGDPGFGGSGGDPAIAPINNYLLLLAVFAIGLAYYAIKKANVKRV